MSKVGVVGQLELGQVLDAPLPVDLLPPDLPVDIDKARIISASHLLTILSGEVVIKSSDIAVDDIDKASPRVIDYGLYIPREDPRFIKAKQLYEGVVFPEEQWLEIARSPSDLAKHVFTKARNADKRKPLDQRAPDRATLHATASRAAGHALESRLGRLEGLYNAQTDELTALRRLSAELKPGRFARYRTENLDTLRRVGHNAIHRAVEVSAINTTKGDVAIDGLHRVIQYRLYGPQSPTNRRLKNWRQYVYMAGKYAESRSLAFVTSMHGTEASLDEYGPFLDAKRNVIDSDQNPDA